MNWLVSLTIVCLAVQCGTAVVQYPEDDLYSSLAFVFDTTGSMVNDYYQLKSHAESIMNYVLARNNSDIKHFVFVPFNDPGIVEKCTVSLSKCYVHLKCPDVRNRRMDVYILKNSYTTSLCIICTTDKHTYHKLQNIMKNAIFKIMCNNIF